jgi:hypothetical protein
MKELVPDFLSNNSVFEQLDASSKVMGLDCWGPDDLFLYSNNRKLLNLWFSALKLFNLKFKINENHQK